MLIVLAVVFAWLSLMPRPARIERPTVDVAASADYLLSSTGVRVLMPTVDPPWRPTSVRTTDDAGMPGWHAGWTQGDDETAYLGVEQAPSRDQTSDANWLAAQIGAAGGAVDFVAAYERRAPTLDADQLALARGAAGDGSIWLLSSSEAVAHLAAALPGQDWSRARALATHPRIAQAAREAGFGQVMQCRPAFNEVAASIESPHEH